MGGWVGYGNLYLAKRVEADYLIRMSCQKISGTAVCKKKKKERVHRSAVSLSSF